MNLFLTKDFFNLEEFEHKELFKNIDNIWNPLVRINKYLLENKTFNIKLKIPSSCYLENVDKIVIGKNTNIEPNTYIKGPCIIGKNCEIRHGAYIRENVIVGDNCVIGHCSEVKNSILLNNVHAAHFAYVGDSILGNNVNLGAGVRCANFRIDNENICFYFQNTKIQTNLKKMGSIIGDDTQIGCNTVLNPATFLGKNVICYANLNVGGVIKSNSIIKQAYSKFLIKELKKRDEKNEFVSSDEK